MGVELWAYPNLEVYPDANAGEVAALAPGGGHGGVNYGEEYPALFERWGWPDRIEPSLHDEKWFAAVYDRPEGTVWWVVGEGRVRSAWLGRFLAD